jgi:hypothetical protein
MDWKKSFARTIRDARGKLPEGRWPDNASRFWQMGLEVPEETVAAGVAEVRQILASGAIGGGLLHIALLMHLLRTRLPGVQVSRLWPDVTALLASEEGQDDTCAAFFRALLRTHFRGRLAADSHHFRYVRLLLDEAGVGSGRARIIVEFLTRLTEIPIGGSFDDSHLRELVYGEIRRDGREDVEAIGPALFSAGEALLRVRRALLDVVDPADVATWDWTDLAEFAHRTAGRELGYLIPEAERVFGTLIPLLGRRLSCARAFELMNTPGVCVNFPPDWDDASRPESEDGVPLGAIRVIRGIGVREMLTVDEYGFGAEFAAEQPAEMWFGKRDGAPIAIWLRTPFEVRRRHQPPGRSRPIHGPKGRCIGHFWSGLASAGDGTTAVSRDAPCIEIPLFRATSLVPVPVWRWREGGFELHLSRVAYYDLAERTDVELRADGLVIASRNANRGNGLLETSKAVVFQRPPLREGVALSMAASGRLIASALIRLPRGPLLIDGNRVFRARELARAPVRQEPSRHLVLVGDMDSGEPHCSIGEVMGVGLEQLLGSGLAAFNWTVDTRNGVPAFSWGDFDWPGVERTPVLANDLPREIDCGGYLLQGSGDVRPVCLDREIESGVWISGAAGLSGVDLLTRWGPLVSRRRIVDDARVGLSRLFADLPNSVRERLCGLVMLSVERERNPTLEQLGLYVAPTALVAHPVRVGLRGRIELMDRAGSSIELYSTREADVDDPELVSEIIFPDRDGLESGSGVRVLWLADVYDLRFRGDDGADLPSSTDSSSAVLRPTALRSARFVLVGDRSLWTLEIALEHLSLPMQVTTVTEPGGVLRELMRLLAGRDSVHPLQAVTIVALYAGIPAGTWVVEIGAVLLDSRATAEIADGRLVLRVAFDWTGFPAREISMWVEDEGRPIEGAVIAETASAADCLKHHATVQMELPSTTFAGASTTLTVVPLIDQVAVTRIAIIVPDEPVTTDGIPAELKRVLADYDERSARHACRRAAVIFVRFARERAAVPLDADRCAGRVDRLFAEVECAGAASATIRSIGMLLADSVHVPAIRPPLSEEFSEFGLTVNEVIVDVLQREEHLGQLQPESIDALRRAAELQRSAATLDDALNRRLEALAVTCERFNRHQRRNLRTQETT